MSPSHVDMPTSEEWLGGLTGDAVVRHGDHDVVLIGGACTKCGTKAFPAPPVCTACMSEDITREEMPRIGTLYAYSIVHAGPKKWRKPFIVGYVDLANGVRVFSHLTGHPLVIGAKVELAVADVGAEADGSPIRTFVFRPMDEGS